MENDSSPEIILLQNLEELVEGMEARIGTNHAHFVSAVFSMENICTLLLTFSDDLPEELMALLRNKAADTIGNFVSCFIHSTLRQDPKWNSYSETEQREKYLNYMDTIRKDVAMLDKKQKGFRK